VDLGNEWVTACAGLSAQRLTPPRVSVVIGLGRIGSGFAGDLGLLLVLPVAEVGTGVYGATPRF
jgi:hypothetical protein